MNDISKINENAKRVVTDFFQKTIEPALDKVVNTIKEKSDDSISEVRSEMLKTIQTINEHLPKDKLNRIIKQEDEIHSKLKSVKNNIDELKDNQKELKIQLTQFSQNEKEVFNNLKRLNSTMEELKDAQNRYNEEVSTLSQEVNNINKNLECLKNMVEKLSEAHEEPFLKISQFYKWSPWIVISIIGLLIMLNALVIFLR